MAISIKFKVSHDEGGSPFWASHREFRRIAQNVTASSAEVEDDADSTDWMTPCAQNRVQGHVQITGPYAFYDVIVTVNGTATEIGQQIGTNRVVGGLSWSYTDHLMNPQASGRFLASALPAAPRSTPVAYSYPMFRIPNDTLTLVCTNTIAGGIQIAPSPTFFITSVKVVLGMTYSIQFLQAWSWVNSGGVPVLVPFGVPGGQDVTVGGGEVASLGVAKNPLPALASPALGAALIRMDEDFDEPALKKEIALAADVLEHPPTAQRYEQAIKDFSRLSLKNGPKDQV